MHCVIPAWGQLWLMEAYLPSWLSYSWPSATPMSILHSSRFSDKLNRNISKLNWPSEKTCEYFQYPYPGANNCFTIDFYMCFSVF